MNSIRIPFQVVSLLLVLMSLIHQGNSITQYLGVFANFRLGDRAGTPHLSTKAPVVYKPFPKKFRSSYRHFHHLQKKPPAALMYSKPIKGDQSASESIYYVYYTPRGPPPHYFSNGMRIPSAFTVNFH